MKKGPIHQLIQIQEENFDGVVLHLEHPGDAVIKIDFVPPALSPAELVNLLRGKIYRLAIRQISPTILQCKHKPSLK